MKARPPTAKQRRKAPAVAARERLRRFVRAHTTLTLAVTATDGSPHAAALFYASDAALRLYVVTDPATRHGAAMLASPVVAGAIQRDGQAWEKIQGVQFRGRGRALAGAARSRAWKLYCARFPFLAAPDARLARALAQTTLWRIDLTWIRLIDNRLGFGHKDEWPPVTAHGKGGSPDGEQSGQNVSPSVQCGRSENS